MEFPPNSHKDSEKGDKPEKKIEKVVTGEVVKRSKPLGRRFKEVFFGGDFKSAARYIAADVMLPAFRNLLVDSAIKGVERVVYGENMVGNRRRTPEYRPRVQYHNPINRTRDRVYLPDQPPHSPLRPAKQDPGEIVLVSREEAELVLERLNDIIDNYDVASVADLYELVGWPSSHVDNKWGWSALNHVGIRQVREGYLLDLPSVEPL